MDKEKEKARYFDLVDEFDELNSVVWKIVEALRGSAVETEGQMYGELLFAKIVGHTFSMARLLPRRSYSPGLIWDVSSISAIARCVMDTHSMLAYLCLDDISKEELEFRIELLALHDTDRRLKVATSLKSGLSRLDLLRAELERRKTRVKKCCFFASLGSVEREKLLVEPPDFHKTRRQRNEASGVDDNFYHAAWIYLSQFTHSHGFALHQLDDFAAHTANGYRAMGIPISFAMPFLAKSVLGMHQLFALDSSALSEVDRNLLYRLSSISDSFSGEPE